jgi:sugar lactone lactonase YvrE
MKGGDGKGSKKFVDLKVPAERRKNHLKYVQHPGKLGGWSSAHGTAVDARGNLLVCDRANNKVAVYEPSGKPLGGLDVTDPWKVMVHPETGEVYVVVKEYPRKYRAPHKTEVVKYSGWKDGSRVLARLDLGRQAGVPFFAIDTSGKESVLWIAGGGKLLRVVDSGTALTVKEDLMERGKGALPGADRMGIDKQRNEIYVNDAWAGLYKYNGLTGEGGKFPVGGIDIDVGQDGNLYILGAVSGISAWMGFKRVTREGKPAPFPAWGGKHENKDAQYGRFGAGYSTKGLCVAPDGKTYMLDMYAWNKYWVTVYDKDGRFLGGPRAKGENKTRPGGALIDKVSNACGGVKVDRAGNIYIGMIGTPKDFKWPDGLKTRVNLALMGSIIKFTPKGGTVWAGKKAGPKPEGPGVQLYRDGKPSHFMAGAVKAFGGAAPCTVFGSCACRSPRFELDEYGRLYVADVVTFCVRVYDAEGNLVRTVGSYGNPDTGGPESLVPTPEIGFGWPISACVAGRNLYVSDVVNRRVTRVDLSYSAEEVCPVGGGAATISRPAPKPEAQTTSAKSDKSDASDRPGETQASAPKAAGESRVRTPDSVCRGWLSMARNYRNAGMHDSARKYLNRVIAKYPGTEWAEKARAELARL